MGIISIDIDGVIAKPLIKSPPIPVLIKKLTNRYLVKHKYSSFEKSLQKAAHYPRALMPDVKEAIKILTENSYKVILNSSRLDFLNNTTLKWLKKHELSNFVENVYLREATQALWQCKVNTILKYNIEIHIDDDMNTVKELVKADILKKIFFITSNRKKVMYFKDNKNVICVPSLYIAAIQILNMQNFNK